MALGNPEDSYVQVATDGSGKKMDNAVLTRDDGTVVYRERVSIASDTNPRIQAEVSGDVGRGALEVKTRQDMILEVLIEIRELIREGLYH